jgi:hypothetical protein
VHDSCNIASADLTEGVSANALFFPTTVQSQKFVASFRCWTTDKIFPLSTKSIPTVLDLSREEELK